MWLTTAVLSNFFKEIQRKHPKQRSFLQRLVYKLLKMHTDDRSMSSSANSHSVSSLSSARLSGRDSDTTRDVKGKDRSLFMILFAELLSVVVTVGESGVGKTSLTLRFVNNHFKENIVATIGASFLTKTVTTKGTNIRFNIWDTAGQEKYRSLASLYYRGVDCAIIVYDVTSRVRVALFGNLLIVFEGVI